jgi:hypothetical protein
MKIKSKICIQKVKYKKAGEAHLVEHQPSKLGAAGSIPVTRSNLKSGFKYIVLPK